MRNALAVVGLTSYCLLCLALLLIWAPRFFYLNVEIAPEFTLEYATVSGLVFVVFLLSVIAAQSVSPTFSAWLGIQVVLMGIAFWLCLFAFDFPPQAEAIAFAHVVAGGLFLFTNLRTYRRLVSDDDD